MSIKPVGGRGLKAPYKTITMRVPRPLSNYFKEVINDYCKRAIIDKNPPNKDFYKLSDINSINLSKFEVIEKASKLLRQKKSAKVTLEKLLQVLYDDKDIKL